ncbi:PREDICTED: putative two-component response regulator ARR21 [Populus euphratica]|uniref:Two-component response regulator ARR21 n=1 Tax=Populus euphratica TaxID=75702 RepID=A0AAJ6UIM6_POPEU|nr:PREDICTED: putative two-component response regulator ARR21 [Populus euphratica]
MASNQSSNTPNSSLSKIHILIVDDDSTSLTVVSATLKTFSYKDNRKLELIVVTVKNPFDALSTLRLKKGLFDLVVSDLHMPEMNGMELQKQVEEEFKLPVIIMSSDESDNVISRSLESGAAFYIVKPANKDDLKNVWHYAVAIKTGNYLSIKEIEGSREPSPSTLVERLSLEDVNSATSINDEKRCRKNGRKEDQEVDSQPPSKKPRVVWTNSLHNRFLQALNHIGLDKAVPKRILECMSVRGLSRENIASHLQKYRIFLKKVAERGGCSSKNLSGRDLRTNFAPSQTFMMFKNAQQEYFQRVARASIQTGRGGNNIPTLGGSSFRNLHSPNQQAPSNNSILQSPYGQSRLFGNANSANQANQIRSGLESNYSIGANMPSHGGVIPTGLTHGTSPMQMYHPQNQARSYLQNFGSPPLINRFGAVGIQATNYGSGVGDIGIINNSLNTNNNYVGIRVTPDGHLIGSGHMQLNKNELSNGFSDGGHPCLMNWARNGNMNAASLGFNIASANYVAQRGSFSAGLEGANQFLPPAPFTSVYHGNTPMPLPPPPPQHRLGLGNGGQNDYVFGLMYSSPPILGGNSNQQPQIGHGELNVSNMLLEPTNNPPAYQLPQGVDQMSTPLHELLTPDFLNSLHIDDNTPWNEQPSSQA